MMEYCVFAVKNGPATNTLVLCFDLDNSRAKYKEIGL